MNILNVVNLINWFYLLLLLPMNTTQINTLQAIAGQPEDNIKKAVAVEALMHDEPEVFFSDLAQGWCAAGIVQSLIYYTDTQAFFDKYYDEIETLRQDNEEQTGMPLKIDGDLKNYLARFAFEQVAYQIANELGLQ